MGGQVAELAMKGGLWGIIVILLSIILLLLKYLHTLIEGRDKRQQVQNEETLKLLESRIATDIKHAQAFNGLNRTIDRLIEKM